MGVLGSILGFWLSMSNKLAVQEIKIRQWKSRLINDLAKDLYGMP